MADAVEAAGGLLPEADPASVNLAALVTDGAADRRRACPGRRGGRRRRGRAGGAGGGGPVDLNTATAAELDALPGIGPVLAQRIVDHRTRRGRSAASTSWTTCPGIGPAIAAELAELVTV